MKDRTTQSVPRNQREMPNARPAKRRRLTPPQDDNAVPETIKPSDLLNHAVNWDLEEQYAHRSKKARKVKEVERLPVITREGGVHQVQRKSESDDESDSFLGSDSEVGKGDDNKGAETPPTDDDDDEKPQIPIQQQIVQAKEEIARLAGLLNEDPEEHAGAFKKLAQIAGPDAHPAIQKIALAAQAAVYKDVIPGYRIRAYKDDDLGTKISKEIRKTRQYEQALIIGYQAYIKTLVSLAKGRSKREDPSSIKTVALSCACNLLLSVPHFNCRTDLIGVLVHEFTAHVPTSDFVKAISTMEQFFKEDEDGAPSLEAVTIISRMLKAKDYRVREEVLNTFMHLRLLTELSVKASTTHAEKPQDEDNKLHGRKVKREKQEHRSKKERKIMKERKAVEKDMQEASAAVDYEAREKMQSETLKVVFVIYFRILKARIPELMGAVLEGLARYAHLINQDFFGDILEALKDIISQAEASMLGDTDAFHPDSEADVDIDPRNRTRESLLSAQTAFTLLSHQETLKSASSLHLDLSFFTNHTYRALYPLTLSADIELGPKSLHLPDPHASQHSSTNNKVNISTPAALLQRTLTSILLTPIAGATTSPLLIATFTKRLLTVLLQTPEKSSLALLDLLSKLTQKHGRKVEALWYSDERKGDGVYRGDADSMDGTHVWSVGSGVWEGELLRKHWCPDVRTGFADIEKGIAGLSKS